MITVGFLRPSDRLEAGIESCRKLGLSCICAPSLNPVHGSEQTFRQVKRILSDGSAYFTIFASITSVEECVAEYGKQALLDLLSTTNVACTGSTTASYLENEVGRKCDLIPETYSGMGVAEEIKDEVGDKLVLLLRSNSGDDRIVSILKDAGAYVVDAAVYSMVPSMVGESHIELMNAIAENIVDAMVFSSPMTFKIFYDQLTEYFGKPSADKYLSKMFKVAIGKPTGETMSLLGHTPDAFPEKSTFDAMLHSVLKKFCSECPRASR